jgi:hypothetical protein
MAGEETNHVASRRSRYSFFPLRSKNPLERQKKIPAKPGFFHIFFA